MSTRGRRGVAAAVSAVAGVVGAVVTNLLTEQWTWTWVVALVTTMVLLVGSQVYLSVAGGGDRSVQTTARGTVAAGRTVDGDVEIAASGPAGSGGPARSMGDGVSAQGPGSVAAGRDVKGKIRIRSEER